MSGKFAYLCNSSKKIVIVVIGFSVMFSLGAILIDKVRIILFKLCHIDRLAKRIEDGVNKAFSKV